LASYLVTGQREQVTEPQALRWYGKCFTQADFKEAFAYLMARHWTRPAVGEPVVISSEQSLMLFAYPNDRRLPSLQLLWGQDNLGDFLRRHVTGDAILGRDMSVSIVRYKPEQRAVIRCEVMPGDRLKDAPTTAYYLRIFPDGRGWEEYRLMCGLSRWLCDGAELAVAKPWAFDAGCSALLLGGLPGCKLKRTVRTSGARDAFERTARALAVLHSYRDPAAAVWSVADHVKRAMRGLPVLSRSMPQLRRELEEIGGMLVERSPGERDSPLGFVHGDFHYGQVLVDENGIGFVDFERAHAGPVLFDLGNWLAARIYHRVEGKWTDDGMLAEYFLAAYAKATKVLLRPEEIGWWTALALLQMTSKPLNRLHDDASGKVARLLDLVSRLLRSGVGPELIPANKPPGHDTR
jgi:Ser/Thr protein kinase RdoA (MazF antagonist)